MAPGLLVRRALFQIQDSTYRHIFFAPQTDQQQQKKPMWFFCFYMLLGQWLSFECNSYSCKLTFSLCMHVSSPSKYYEIVIHLFQTWPVKGNLPAKYWTWTALKLDENKGQTVLLPSEGFREHKLTWGHKAEGLNEHGEGTILRGPRENRSISLPAPSVFMPPLQISPHLHCACKMHQGMKS